MDLRKDATEFGHQTTFCGEDCAPIGHFISIELESIEIDSTIVRLVFNKLPFDATTTLQLLLSSQRDVDSLAEIERSYDMRSEQRIVM